MDVCIDCQTTQESGLWPSCKQQHENHIAVHVKGCNRCKAPIGYVMDDDYCGPNILICPTCLGEIGKKALVHANSAGLVGGYAVCGDKQGDCTDYEDSITCPVCLDMIKRK